MMAERKDNIRVYLQPAFLICVIVLAIAGAGMSITMKHLGIILDKEPVPLKKSLEMLDEADAKLIGVVLNQRRFYIPKWLYGKL